LPPGYDGTRAVALKLLNQTDLLEEVHAYIRPPTASKELPAAVTAEEAIGDLPPIYAREQLKAGTLRRGARRFDVPIRYDGRRKVTAFAEQMRTWPGFTAPDFLRDHVIRYLPRDYQLFARLNPGDQYPQAW
jgi:DNA (cytosine-5)-methyltransferase 1